MTERAHPEWDDSYTADTPAPWDIGRPQPTFARLADEGRLTGRLLDAGCRPYGPASLPRRRCDGVVTKWRSPRGGRARLQLPTELDIPGVSPRLTPGIAEHA